MKIISDNWKYKKKKKTELASGRVSSPVSFFWMTMASMTRLSLTLMKLFDLYRFHLEMTTFTLWLGPHLHSLPLPRSPVRPLGFLQGQRLKSVMQLCNQYIT